MPLNWDGVTIWTRKPFERFATSEFDAPFAWKFDRADSMVIFEDVKVPWERVFTHNNAALSRNIYFKTPSHAMKSSIKCPFFLKMQKLILGIARKSGAQQCAAGSGGSDTLGRLAAAGKLNAMIAGQVEDAEEMMHGHFNVNRRHMYGALHWCTQNYATICETVRELMGGGPFQMPADVSVIKNPELRERPDLLVSAGSQLSGV